MGRAIVSGRNTSFSRVASLLRNPQEISVVDTFTRSDNPLSMGQTEKGGLNWNSNNNNVGILNNAAYFTSAIDNSYAFVDCGRPNIDIRIMINTYSFPTSSKQLALYFRISGLNYWRLIRSTGNLLLQKSTGGSLSTLLTQAMTFNDGDEFRVRAIGNFIECFLNGTFVFSLTDTAFNANTGHGFGCGGSSNLTTALFDNFQLLFL